MDSLLDQYKGKEQQLYRDVVEEHSELSSTGDNHRREGPMVTSGDDDAYIGRGATYGTPRTDSLLASNTNTPVPLGHYVNEYTPDANSYYRNDYKDAAFNNRYQAEYIKQLEANGGNNSPAIAQNNNIMRDPGAGASLVEIRRIEKVCTIR